MNHKALTGRYGQGWYKTFVYKAGNILDGNLGRISGHVLEEVHEILGRLKLGKSLCYRFRSLTEGYAFGTKDLIEEVQKINKRKKVKARPVLKDSILYSTRQLE
ncbi:MAG: hypothetical protein HQM16_12000 [Deltaproteobacteria bacterium]|nr:hypothetical protein [Deltaproteobacteria bacterium]